MKRIQISMPEILYKAAADQAAQEDRADARTDGVASLTRHALRLYLNQRNHKLPKLTRSGLREEQGS